MQWSDSEDEEDVDGEEEAPEDQHESMLSESMIASLNHEAGACPCRGLHA